MAYLLKPEAQAYTYDKGYFYPGPAVKDVPLSMAPKESQDAIREYGRPEYEKWLAEFPHTQSLEPKAQVEAYRIWDQQIGAQKTKCHDDLPAALPAGSPKGGQTRLAARRSRQDKPNIGSWTSGMRQGPCR